MGEQWTNMQTSQWYHDEPDLQEARLRCGDLLFRFNATRPDQDGLRRELLRELLGGFDDSAAVVPRFQCAYGSNITLGANTIINHDVLCMDDAAITLADHAMVGPGSQLITAWHPLDDHEHRRSRWLWERCEPITLSENCWLAAGVIVCPGITIGRNTVVGAGSVVTRDLPDGVFAAGNPARVVREL